MTQKGTMVTESRLDEILKSADINRINEEMHKITGIVNFVQDERELLDFKALSTEKVLQGDREFGDFQTPVHLTRQVCDYLYNYYKVNPALVIEPTFGKGNFIQSSIEYFPEVQRVYGVEIQKNYHMLAKKELFQQALINPGVMRPEISLIHDDIFHHSFDKHVLNTREEVLIIGNPPWVTNSELGSLDSNNLPHKQNFKQHKGLDALTGKSNFDICEYIILKLLEIFDRCNGTLAMLCKNSVAKKIVRDLPKRKFNISDIRLLNIDAKREFNAAADASLFVVRLGGNSERIICDTYKLEEPEVKLSSFGWLHHKFVSNIGKYEVSSVIDDYCQFTWRSGIKHDCSSVMELDCIEGKLMNKLKETVDIENSLVYDFLKSSDLKGNVTIQSPRKKVIVTQKSIGENTAYIEHKFPRTWDYLQRYRSYFDARKSSIYKGKPNFSIFGVGDYSFSAYKIAISGMYKTSTFTFVSPIAGKTVMLDDTCYFLSFDDLNTALFTFALLNSSIVQAFLQSVVFLDDKRPYTKDILMRIDLYKASEHTRIDEIQKILLVNQLQVNIDSITEKEYGDYIEFLQGQALLL